MTVTLVIVIIFSTVVLYLSIGYVASYAIYGKFDEITMGLWLFLLFAAILVYGFVYPLRSFGLWIHKKFVKRKK